nr:4216_t:CDS:2 [Entrophospora candida]
MGRVIHFKSHTRLRKGAAKLRSLDYAEHNRFSNIVENEIGIFLQAALTTVGNILPLNAMLEEHQEIMQQLLVITMTKAKLPSGAKKVVSSSARGTVGIVDVLTKLCLKQAVPIIDIELKEIVGLNSWCCYESRRSSSW